MAVVQLQGGRSYDIASPSDVHDITTGVFRHEIGQWRAERAKKRIEQVFPVQPAAATVFLGQPQSIGPDEGYVWSLKLVSCVLSAAGSIAVYKSSSSGDRRRPLEQIAGQSVAGVVSATVTWSSDQARIRHGEGLYIESGVSITGVYLTAWEVPSELESEIYD